MGHVDNVVARDHNFVLHVRGGHSHTFSHLHLSDNLLTQEISDLNVLATVVDRHVDREVSVHESHLVLEAL